MGGGEPGQNFALSPMTQSRKTYAATTAEPSFRRLSPSTSEDSFSGAPRAERAATTATGSVAERIAAVSIETPQVGLLPST